MEIRGKERGITLPIVVPEGYWDTEKVLKECIDSMQERLEECNQDLKDIHSLILSN